MPDQEYYAKILKRTVHSPTLNALSIPARWLYVVFAAEAHGYETFRMKYTDIAEVTLFAHTTIRRAIQELVDGGFITYEHGGLRNPNVYSLTDTWLPRS